MNCPKRSYLSEELAVTALLEARSHFASNAAVTVYECALCGHWHLTSKGHLHPLLAHALTTGEIGRRKEAYYWERKLK